MLFEKNTIKLRNLSTLFYKIYKQCLLFIIKVKYLPCLRRLKVENCTTVYTNAMTLNLPAKQFYSKYQ